MKKLLAILIMILSFSACDESTNPSDDSYAIEKTLTENAITQEFTSGDDIKITVTGGTINVETEIKVKKVSASDVPNLTLDKTVIGKNIFKIKIKGQKTFSPALKIEIKYDDVYLKSKNLTTADIKGLVHLPSGWVLGDYTIDQANKKIIFSISSTSLPSKQKDGLLDDEDEITICDGYTTTDSGQNDISIYKSFVIEMTGYTNRIKYDNNGNEYSNEIVDFIVRSPLTRTPFVKNGNVLVAKWDNINGGSSMKGEITLVLSDDNTAKVKYINEETDSYFRYNKTEYETLDIPFDQMGIMGTKEFRTQELLIKSFSKIYYEYKGGRVYEEFKNIIMDSNHKFKYSIILYPSL